MFEGFDPGAYAEEARERWGHTVAYRESSRRTARYGEADRAAIRAEAEAIEARLAELMAAGEPAGGEAARAAAEAHRDHLARWFDPCPPAMHRGLAEIYVAHPRFVAHDDERAPGLAIYAHDAIVASTAAAGE